MYNITCLPSVYTYCTDPLALNYNMTTECTDNSLCEYLPIIDVGLDTLLYETGCNELGILATNFLSY